MTTELEQLANDFAWDYKDFYKAERTFKEMAEDKGFTKVTFYNQDADSFGPLVRGIYAWKDGERQDASYG